MNATGGFDAALQFTEPAINRILTAMHRSGAATHEAASVSDAEIVELLVNLPSIALDTSGQVAAPNVAATTTTRILYHSRPADDPADPGVNASCEVAIRAHARIGDGSAPGAPANTAPVGADSYLLTDYTATGIADVVVHGVGGATAAQVQAKLLDVVHAQRGVYPLEFIRGAGVVEAAGAVIDRNPAPPVVAVGLNFSVKPGASAANLITSICYQDWAMALAGDYLIARLLERLNADLGALPPPYGPTPVVVDQAAGTTVYLDSLTLTLAAGSIDLAGAVRRADPGLFGELTATWTASITLAMDGSRHIQASVSEPAVQLSEWYAVVGNFLSGGRIATTVAALVHDQLTGGLAGAEIDALVDTVVARIAAGETTAQIPIEVAATSVEIRPDAVVVHGSITTTGNLELPRAVLSVIQGDSPDRLTLHAGGSWAPGGELVSITFDYGDGAAQTLSGPSMGLVTEHLYAPGMYSACITVADRSGRTATACVPVQPGSLIIELRDAPNWEFCSSQPTLTFDVQSSGAGIRGALVTVSGTGWQVVAETDHLGVAQMTLDPQQVQQHGAVPGRPSPYHLGAVDVVVAKPGWVGRQTRLWMVDCDALNATKLNAIARRNEILDRLAGYAALRDLAARIGHDRPTVDDILSAFAPPKPARDKGLDRIEQAADFLNRLDELITDGGEVLPVSQVLGIRPDDPETNAVVQRRIGELWDGVESGAQQWLDRYGSPDDSRRP